jgi:hypothetical protein
MLADMADGAADVASVAAWPCELRNRIAVGVMATVDQRT